MKKVSKQLFLILITILLLTAFTYATSDMGSLSSWATEPVAKAISLDFVPTDLQAQYQNDITRAEFAKISIYFLASQYNYQAVFYGSDGNDYYSAEEFISQFLELRKADGVPKYQQSRYWDTLPPDIRADAELFGKTPEQYSWGSLILAMNPFTDSNDPAFYDVKSYINAAYVLGIVNGREDGSFGPADSITRQEAATMLLRTYEVYCNEMLPSVQPEYLFDLFSDAGEIGIWAQEAVSQMAGLEIMNGIGHGTFAPNAHYTREQCYSTFLRLYQNMPTSKSQNNVAAFYSIEEGISQIINNPFFTLYYRLDMDTATIIYGTQGGMIGMGGSQIYIFYANGGKRVINTSTVDADSFSLSEDQLYLSYIDGGILWRLDIEKGTVSTI